MPTSRPKLMLDEQSFQDMLAAAFTVQEHNAKRKKSLQPQRACERCGAPLLDDASACTQCVEEPRPGEELQRKWASLWLMSQEQALGPESFSSAQHEVVAEPVAGELQPRRFAEAIQIPAPDEGIADRDEPEVEAEWQDSPVPVFGEAAGFPKLTAGSEPSALETVDEAAAAPAPGSLRDLRLKLRFHRADLYLVLSVAVSTIAMVWVLSATPAPGAQRKPRLRPWERALISLGLAEAPEPPPRRGNPNISVWVDPKTALYYCVGEELYGKAPGGHLATQREAQLDQFEPAGRVACE